jgi:prepilin-type N-terminal cleavage/methylation domain-containing protein
MKNRNEKKFTLVELLVVISIIALLAALLFPAISSVRSHAKKVQTQSQINALKTAITQYEAQYGLLPITSTDVTGSTTEFIKDKDTYDRLIAILSQVDGPATGWAAKGNSRKTRFLSVTTEYDTNGYVDPWGNRFRIGIDSDYDGDVAGFADRNNDGDTTDVPDDVLNGKVFIYSLGAPPSGVTYPLSDQNDVIDGSITKANGDSKGSKTDDIVGWE